MLFEYGPFCIHYDTWRLRVFALKCSRFRILDDNGDLNGYRAFVYCSDSRGRVGGLW